VRDLQDARRAERSLRERLAHRCDWREKPPFGCVLRCVECPPVGGDTMWANMALAYEKLPDSIKTQIAGLRARHSIEATFGARMPIEKRLALKAQFPDAEHPVVRTHPETGEKILFVNSFVTHFTNYHVPANVRYGQGLHRRRLAAPAVPDRPGARSPNTRSVWRWKPNSVASGDNRATQHYAVMDTRRATERWSAPASRATRRSEPRQLQSTIIQRKVTLMNFLDGALFPENQDKLVITAAPYGPEWLPSDFPEDIAVTMDEQVQKAVDCYNAGATVLHVHVREAGRQGLQAALEVQ
jgi:hypothetical protein